MIDWKEFPSHLPNPIIPVLTSAFPLPNARILSFYAFLIYVPTPMLSFLSLQNTSTFQSYENNPQPPTTCVFHLLPPFDFSRKCAITYSFQAATFTTANRIPHFPSPCIPLIIRPAASWHRQFVSFWLMFLSVQPSIHSQNASLHVSRNPTEQIYFHFHKQNSR